MAAPGCFRTAALLGPALGLALGCTNLLGIDGNYVNGPAETGGAAGLDGRGGRAGESPGGAGGDPLSGDGGESSAAGGSGPGGGGAPGSGGSGGIGAESGGTSSGAGGLPAGGASGSGGTGGSGNASGGGTSVAACTPGVYVGTYTGTHKTSSSATFVTVYPAGTVTVQVTAPDGGTPTMNLTFARQTLPPKDGFDAKVTLTFDCPNNTGSGPLQKDAQINVAIPYVRGAIDGTVQASFKTATTLRGSWSEHEVLVPDFATGVGTWEATLR